MERQQISVQEPVTQNDPKCVYIDEAIHRRAKVKAATRGENLRTFVEDAIERKLALAES